MRWKLFANLAELADDSEIEVDVEPGATVGDALSALLDGRPDLKDQVLNDDGELRDHINVLRNGKSVHGGEGLETELSEGDELALFPPVSGG